LRQFPLGRPARDPGASLPSRSVSNFRTYMKLCCDRARIAKPECRFVVFNVKYDQAHLISQPFWPLAKLPPLFYLMRENRWRIIDIHRENVHALVISNCVAMQTNIYHSTDLAPGTAQRAVVRIDPDDLADELFLSAEAYRLIGDHFAHHREYLLVSYEEMFTIGYRKRFRRELLEKLGRFFNIENRFDRVPHLKKILDADALAHVQNKAEILPLIKT
jgi:hypothetical protein